MTQVKIWKNWRYHKFFTATTYSIIFTITLTVVFILANLIFPYPNMPNYPNDVSLKLKYFAEHKNEYNAIFIGPSTTSFGIVPNLFDKLMAEQNREIKSFNLGFSAATVAEIDFSLSKIIALKPANLKWLFIEYPDLSNLYEEKIILNGLEIVQNLTVTLLITKFSVLLPVQNWTEIKD